MAARSHPLKRLGREKLVGRTLATHGRNSRGAAGVGQVRSLRTGGQSSTSMEHRRGGGTKRETTWAVRWTCRSHTRPTTTTLVTASACSSAVAKHVDSGPVLYPGSYIDIAPSVFFDEVTYVDMDRRATRFFAEADQVAQLVAHKRVAAGRPPLDPAAVRFQEADYNEPLPLADGSIRLLVSLYAGFVSERCRRYLAPGGWLLANNSHGDASMASLDPAYSLAAVVTNPGGDYRVTTKDLARHMIPKKGHAPSAEALHQTNKGVAFTHPAFAYLFVRG